MSHTPPSEIIGSITSDPTGWFDRSEAVITVDDLAREVTLTPTGAHFDIYIIGKLTRFTAPVTIPISADEGFHYVCYDGTSFVDSLTFPDLSASREFALTCFVYWDATAASFIRVCDERHGVNMPWVVHSWLHRHQGTQYDSGFGVTAIKSTTTATPAGDDSQARIYLGGGQITDEDISYSIVHNVAPANPFEQDLGTGLTVADAARLPVYYLDGAAGNLRRAAPNASRLALKAGAVYPQYNLFNGAAWVLSDPPGGQRVIYWLCVTNDQDNPVFLLMGQGTYGSLASAQAVLSSSIIWGTSPPAEIIILQKIIYRTRNSWTTSAVRAKIEDIQLALTNTVTVPSATSHNNLANLSYSLSGHTGFQQSTYVSAISNPSVNNDSVDTAALGRSFAAGDFWVNQSISRFYGCVAATPTAAIWVALN